MLTQQDLYEMGWNDVIGNLNRAYDATIDQKKAFANKIIAGTLPLPRNEQDYITGTKAAATSFINGNPLEYLGSAEIVADMIAKST